MVAVETLNVKYVAINGFLKVGYNPMPLLLWNGSKFYEVRYLELGLQFLMKHTLVLHYE